MRKQELLDRLPDWLRVKVISLHITLKEIDEALKLFRRGLDQIEVERFLKEQNLENKWHFRALIISRAAREIFQVAYQKHIKS